MHEILHFNGNEAVLKSKHMIHDVRVTLSYIDEMLAGSRNHGEQLIKALTQTEWRMNSEDLRIIEGRRYMFKAFKAKIAWDGGVTVYETLHNSLFRLQLGFDKNLIDSGIVLLNSARSEKSLIGTSRELAIREMEELFPTISLPVSIALFDLSVNNNQAMEEYRNAA